MTTTETLPPLADFVIVGVENRRYQAAPDAPSQPGGSCWHCGAAIVVCVLAQSRATGEVVTIGTTCAERTGLDAEELRKFLAEKFAAERAERAEGNRLARIAAGERREAEATGEFGEHGTANRWESGCRCDDCWTVAPHGTIERVRRFGCSCEECVSAALSTDEYRLYDRDVLVDLSTGARVLDAREVSTKYGSRWRSDELDVWLPVNPARRTTLSSKGFVEAEVPHLCERRGRGAREWWETVAVLAEPTVDSWGEAIEVVR
jgi:hypothetical protein